MAPFLSYSTNVYWYLLCARHRATHQGHRVDNLISAFIFWHFFSLKKVGGGWNETDLVLVLVELFWAGYLKLLWLFLSNIDIIWNIVQCLINIYICIILKDSHIFLYLFWCLQGSRISWGSVQPPSPSPDPWRRHHSPVWQTGIRGLWFIWGINSVLHGHEWNLILKISRIRISWVILKVPDSWTSLGIYTGNMVCRVEFDYLFYFSVMR